MNYYQDLQGLLPIKEVYHEIFGMTDITLFGMKLVFYTKGMILVDQRLGTFVLPYEALTHLIFHTGNEWWLEIRLKED